MKKIEKISTVYVCSCCDIHWGNEEAALKCESLRTSALSCDHKWDDVRVAVAEDFHGDYYLDMRRNCVTCGYLQSSRLDCAYLEDDLGKDVLTRLFEKSIGL